MLPEPPRQETPDPPTTPPVVLPTSKPVVPPSGSEIEPPPALVQAARRRAQDHHARTGDPIDTATLRQKLGLPVALVLAVQARLDGDKATSLPMG